MGSHFDRPGVLPAGTEEEPKHSSKIEAGVRLCREPSSAAAVRSETSRLTWQGRNVLIQRLTQNTIGEAGDLTREHTGPRTG